MIESGLVDNELYDDEDLENDEDYTEEEIAFIHAEALMAHAQELIARVGDPQIAFDLMDLDPHEKRMLFQRMQEQLYLEQHNELMSQLSEAEIL